MNDTTAYTREEVEAIDWSRELQPATHPVKIRIADAQVFDLDSGALIAQVAPEYRVYWRHGHVHFARRDDDGWIPGRGHAAGGSAPAS